MTELYQEIILRRTRHPLHAGAPAAFDAEASATSPICGDRVHVYLTCAGMAVAHESEGCAIMSASADLMASAVAGKTRDEISDLSNRLTRLVTSGEPDPALGELNAFAEIAKFPSRIGCATLPWRALEEALAHV